MRPPSDSVYVIHAIKTIGGVTTAEPIGCKSSLEGAQQSMARYARAHKNEVSGGDEWLAEETVVRTYNMMTEIYNCRTADRIDIRIYNFKLTDVIS